MKTNWIKEEHKFQKSFNMWDEEDAPDAEAMSYWILSAIGGLSIGGILLVSVFIH